MRKFFTIKVFVLPILLSLSVIYSNLYAQGIDQQPAGKVNFFNDANWRFDQYISNPDTELKQWMNSHYDRMLTYAPHFDTRLSWYPNALVYQNSYGVYTNENLVNTHPEWIMRDAQGRKLYIPFACNNGACSQFAGDFSNPAFRRYKIAQFIDVASRGYRGIWFDDINMTWRAGNGYGVHVDPIDYTTGKPMTLTNWRRHMAEYMEEIRAALPNIEISHNVIWFSDTINLDNPYIARQIAAADFVTLERGGNDAGLTNGFHTYGYESFLRFNDYIHDHGANIIMMDYGTTIQNREYGLATWLLISEGKDIFSNDQMKWRSPDTWWEGFDLNLGNALGSRYTWNGLLRRDFECGTVILNQPGTSARTVNVGASFTNLNGQAVSSVYLTTKSAAILQKPCDTSPGNQEILIRSFQNGANNYTGTEDTVIDDSFPGNNFASSTNIELDGWPRRTSALMYWDISDVSSSATVESVELTLYVTNKSWHNYGIYEMKQPWNEHQATWYQYAKSGAWATSGAKSYFDRGTTILANLTSPTKNRYITVNLNATGIALVQSWVDNPSLNNGFIFTNYFASDGLDLASSETSDISKRPKITIKYRD